MWSMQCLQAPFRTWSSWWRHGKISLHTNGRWGVAEMCLLFTESVLRNQSPLFVTETLSIFSFLACVSLIAVMRSGGQVRVLLLNESLTSNIQATWMNHYINEPDEATHPGEDSDKEEKYTMMVRRVQGESRVMLTQVVPSLQHCQWGCVPECKHRWVLCLFLKGQERHSPVFYAWRWLDAQTEML